MALAIANNPFDLFKRFGCIGNRKGKWDKAELRAKKLIERLGESIQLYLIFYMCDNDVDGKIGDDYIWFKGLIEKD